MPSAKPRPRDRRALATAVRELRSGLRVSQEDLSAATGHGRQWIGQVESGRRSVPFEGVVAISEALGIELAELVDRFEAARRRDRR